MSRDAAEPRNGEGYRRVVLAFLLAAYTFNFIDRTIVATIGQAIKVDLKLSDTELGLLGGLAFAILYTLLGVPIARLAERHSRVTIIAVSLVVWSGFTVACGFAGGFAALLALRVGVGVGEAGCSPPSHSVISDYFEPRRRATALSVYAFGIPLGAMIGAIAGGFLAKTVGWRETFMIVGAPGIALAILLRLIVREPQRGQADLAGAPPLTDDVTPGPAPAPPGRWLATEFRELASVSATLFGGWPMCNIMFGVTLASFAGYGVGQFAAPYFIRAFGLDYATVGLIFGLIGGTSAGLGTLAGGFVSDFASHRDPRWYALTPAIGLAIAAPIYVMAYLAPDWRLAAAVLFLPGIFSYTYLAPTFAVVQNVVPTRQRATAAAVMLLFLNIIALGGGPLFTGWAIDALAQMQFGGDFGAACPGGTAPAGSATALLDRCHGALVWGTRTGILITLGFYVWGAIHYFLGAIGLAARLERARVARLSPIAAAV